MFTSLKNFREQVLKLVGLPAPFSNPQSPGFGKTLEEHVSLAPKEPEPTPVLIFGEMEVYPSIYGYPKRGLKVFRATEDGAPGAYFGFIKEEPVPGEDGNLVGCVYYTKDRRLQTKNAPRFYASPLALITAAGLTHYDDKDNPLGAGTMLLGHDAKDQEAEHAKATGEPGTKSPLAYAEGDPQIGDPIDQGVGDSAGRILGGLGSALEHAEGNSPPGTVVHHPADLDPEPEAVKVDQRVRATALTPATTPGSLGSIHNVHGDGFVVKWDGDVTPRSRMYYRHQVDFLDDKGNVIGKPAGVDQAGFAAAPVD